MERPPVALDEIREGGFIGPDRGAGRLVDLIRSHPPPKPRSCRTQLFPSGSVKPAKDS